jgi:serine protease Do
MSVLICSMAAAAVAQDQKAPTTRPARGWLGCKLAPNEDGKGIVVVEVLANSPAAAAGLQEKDTLTQLNGKPIDDIQGFVASMRQSKPGDEAKFTVLRDNQEKQITVTFGDVPKDLPTTQPAKQD